MKKFLLIVFLCILASSTCAQTISTGTGTAGGGSGATQLSVGTTAQRPNPASTGMIRVNSSLNTIEAYVNAAWQTVTTGGPFAINIMSWPYAASCDGATDDTTTFESAEAVGLPIFVPPTAHGCAVGNLTWDSGIIFIGANGGPWYSATSGTRSYFTAVSGTTTAILNPDGATNVGLSYIDVAGSGFSSAYECIAGGAGQIIIDHSSIRYCGDGGIGGNDENYTSELISTGSNWYGNGQHNATAAITDIVDSQIIGGALTANQDGIELLTGSNSNTINGVRIEWNIGDGLYCYECTDENITGSQFDANYNNGIHLYGASHMAITGNWFRRNGSTATYGKQEHIYFEAPSNDVVVTGNTTSWGVNDNGDGSARPAFSVYFNIGGDQGLVMNNNDFSGCTDQQGTSGCLGENASPAEYRINNNTGVAQNFYTGEGDFYGQTYVNQLATPSAPTITPEGTTGSSTWSYKIVAVVNGTAITTTPASTAGTTTSGNATLSSVNYNVVAWTEIEGATEYRIYRTAHATSPTTTGLIATFQAGGSGTSAQPVTGLYITDTGLAGDSSTAPTTNTTGNASVAGNLSVTGSINSGSRATATVTNSSSPYTVPIGVSLILVDTSGGAVTINLPNPANYPSIKIIDQTGYFGTNNVTVAQYASENIEGIAASLILASNWGTYELKAADGANWYKVSSSSNLASITYGTSGGTFTAPAGVTEVIICGRGGSGGGGGGGAGGGGSTAAGAGGGGGGGSGGSIYTVCKQSVVTPGSGYTAMVGSGGSSGTSGAKVSANSAGSTGGNGGVGGNGGATSLGALFSVPGGIGGGAGSGGTLAAGGSAGYAGEGLLGAQAPAAGGAEDVAGGSVSQAYYYSPWGTDVAGSAGGAAGGSLGGGGGGGGGNPGLCEANIQTQTAGGAGAPSGSSASNPSAVNAASAGCGGSGGPGGGGGGKLASTGSQGASGAAGGAGTNGYLTVTWHE